MPDPDRHIVFTEPFDASAIERARAVGRVTLLDACDETTLASAAADCHALVMRSATRVTERVLAAARRLRVIGRAGVGLDNIDLDAARRRGVVVVYTPFAATDAVADLTVGLMISLVRKASLGDAMVRRGEFHDARERCVGSELGNLTVGIVGLGRIGRAVARRCRHGFGMTVLFNDIIDIGHLDFVARRVEKAELFRRCDVVSLHVPLTAKTHRMIDAAALAQFKRGSVLINTSRGAVVDGAALSAALRRGKLSGAALDVFDPEPPRPDDPLLTAPNVVLTPHIGARATGALAGMSAVVDDVLAVLRGDPPAFPAGSEEESWAGAATQAGETP